MAKKENPIDLSQLSDAELDRLEAFTTQAEKQMQSQVGGLTTEGVRTATRKSKTEQNILREREADLEQAKYKQILKQSGLKPTLFDAIVGFGGEGLTLGHLPELSGALEAAFTPRTMEQTIPENRAKMELIKEAFPGTAVTSEVAGSLAPLLTGAGGGAAVSRLLAKLGIKQAPKATPAIPRLAKTKGIAQATAEGAIAAEGQADAVTPAEKGKAMLTGGAVGGALGSAFQTVKSIAGLEGVKQIAEISQKKALDAAGLLMSDVLGIMKKEPKAIRMVGGEKVFAPLERTRKVGQTILEEADIKATDTPSDINVKLTEKLDSVGRQIGETIGQASDDVVFIPVPAIAGPLETLVEKYSFAKRLESPQRKAIEKVIDDVFDKGDEVTLEEVWKFRKILDDQINYNRDPTTGQLMEKAKPLIDARTALEKIIDDAVGGVPGLKETYRELKKRYGLLSDATIAVNKVIGREQNKRTVSALHTLARGGGVGGGAAILGVDPKIAVTLAAGTLAASQFEKAFGPQNMARAYGWLAKNLKDSPASFGDNLKRIRRAMQRAPHLAVAEHFDAYRKDEKYRKAVDKLTKESEKK